MTTTRQEALAWLHQAPDASGECDRCHNDPRPLWMLPDDWDGGGGAWMYCEECYRQTVAGRIVRQ